MGRRVCVQLCDSPPPPVEWVRDCMRTGGHNDVCGACSSSCVTLLCCVTLRGICLCCCLTWACVVHCVCRRFAVRRVTVGDDPTRCTKVPA